MFLGLWWEKTNRAGALAGMITGLVVWTVPMLNEVLPTSLGDEGPDVEVLAQWVSAIGSALVAVPVVFAVTTAVSLVTADPPVGAKRMVRQCHSPEPMSQLMTAEDVVRGGDAPGGGRVPRG